MRIALALASGLLASAVGAETPAEGPTPPEVPAPAEAPAPIAVDPAAPAAPATEAATPERTGSRLVGEIVVTAQKREESIEDVPISVEAFGAEQLDAQSVLDMSDLPKVTPGLTVTTQVGFTTTFLRGVGSDAYLLADPSVAIYVDDVYFPSVLGVAQDFGTIERIEVLKGPQGTLFGRNALGGAIRIITRDPALDAPEGSFQAIVAQNNQRNVRGYFSTPLFGDTLGISVAGYDNIRDTTADGEYGPPGDRTTLPRERADGVRGKLAFHPFDNLEFHLASYLFKQDATGSLYAPNTDPSLLTQLATGFAPGQDPYHGAVNAPPVFEIKNSTTFGRARWGLPWLDIRGFGSQQSQNNTQATDFDGTTMPLAKFQGRTFLDVDSAELQLVSNETSPGADWLEWIVGAYWFKSRGGITANFSAGGTDLSLDAPEVLGIPIPENLVELFEPLLGRLPFPGGDINSTGVLRTKSLAGFAQATVKLPADFSLTLGGRYQDEKRVLEESIARLINLDGSTVPISPRFSGDDDPRFRDTTKSFDPKVSLAWRAPPSFLGGDPLLYVTWQTATKSSTFNVINLTDGPEGVKAEHMEAWEVGFKTTLFDSARFHVAAFHYDIDDPQVQVVSLLNGGAVSFENAGSERVKGVDFDALIQLFPTLTDGGLVLTLSGAYLDAIYSSYTDGSGFATGTGIFSGGNDYSGNDIVRAPKYSGNAGLNYTFPTTRGPIELGASYYYNGGFYYLAQGTSNVEEKAYGTLGVSLSWLYERWNLRATVFGRNVTNEHYNIGRFIVDFGSTDAVAELSTWGLRLNWDF